MQLPPQKYILIGVIVCLILAISILYYWKFSFIEYFSNSKTSRVTTGDGACESRHQSIVDYYSKPYPYYDRNSYFKPLDQLKPYNDNNTVNFERKYYTTLYNSPQ